MREDGSATFTIRRDELRAHDTLVITSTQAKVSSIGVAIAGGPVAPCTLVPDTPSLRPAPGSGAGATSVHP